MRKSGFTLLELLIVIAVIAILTVLFCVVVGFNPFQLMGFGGGSSCYNCGCS